MNPNTSAPYDTFSAYQAASQLWKEALELLNRLGEKAEAGDRKARRLEDLAWMRYNRRTARVNYAAETHWGAL